MSKILKPNGDKYNPDFGDLVLKGSLPSNVLPKLNVFEQEEKIRFLKESCGVKPEKKIIKWRRYNEQ